MISYPKNWKSIGKLITAPDFLSTLRKKVRMLDCRNLSFSGGIDSTIMLYIMREFFGDNINIFTIGINKNHPDVVAAKYIAIKLTIENHHTIFIPTNDQIKSATRKDDSEGDVAVRLFYNEISKKQVHVIIACDGIDEFMCGYYDHQDRPSEETYYYHIRRLGQFHLTPLNKNSSSVSVLLPYLSPEIITLLSQVPLSEKVLAGKQRKRMMINAALELGIPHTIISRRKYGFCDALLEKKS